MKACKSYHCPGFSTGNGYCADHQHLAPKPFNNVKNDPLTVKAYATTQWRQFRLRYLAAHPICACCGKKATSVDHFRMSAPEMLRQFGKFIYEDVYYRPLCGSCNTAARNKMYRKKKVEIDQYLI